MNKKEVLTPFILGLIALGFAYVCVMVFLLKGKSAKWISRKMKIGGLLLSFSAVVQSGCRTNQLCYKFADPIPDIGDVEMKLTCVRNNLITGKLKNTQSIYDLKKRI
jgi:hypothetical protein